MTWKTFLGGVTVVAVSVAAWVSIRSDVQSHGRRLSNISMQQQWQQNVLMQIAGKMGISVPPPPQQNNQ